MACGTMTACPHVNRQASPSTCMVMLDVNAGPRRCVSCCGGALHVIMAVGAGGRSAGQRSGAAPPAGNDHRGTPVGLEEPQVDLLSAGTSVAHTRAPNAHACCRHRGHVRVRAKKCTRFAVAVQLPTSMHWPLEALARTFGGHTHVIMTRCARCAGLHASVCQQELAPTSERSDFPGARAAGTPHVSCACA
jgi:hypothetical protein